MRNPAPRRRPHHELVARTRATLDVIPRPRSTHAAPARKSPSRLPSRSPHQFDFFSDDRTRTHVRSFGPWTSSPPRRARPPCNTPTTSRSTCSSPSTRIPYTHPTPSTAPSFSRPTRTDSSPLRRVSPVQPARRRQPTRARRRRLAETTTRPHPGGVTRDINTTRNDVVSELQSSLRCTHTSTRSRPSCPARTVLLRRRRARAATPSPPPRASTVAPSRAKSATASPSSAGAHPLERRARARERVRLEIEQRAASGRSSSASSSRVNDARTRARSDERNRPRRTLVAHRERDARRARAYDG